MWFWLVGAVVAEVFATITLRFTEGFTRLVPSLLKSAPLSLAAELAAAYLPWA